MSVPERIGSQRSAALAVALSRGSITTIAAPVRRRHSLIMPK